MKTAIIRQPAGAGDIFFSQKIGYHFLNQGYRVIWPVIKEYSYFKEYMKDIEYPCREEDFDYKEIYLDSSKNIKYYNENILIPIESSVGNKIMSSKYEMIGIPYFDWKDFFNFERNHQKENELFNFLELNENIEYNFILNVYGSPPNYLIDNRIKHKNDSIKTIYMNFIEGYTIFDWCKVIENASYLYLNDSSINYLIEKLNLKNKELISLWTRRGPNFSEIDYIFNMNLYEKKYE